MNDERQTPQWLFDKLNGIYHFTLDAAAAKENAKCENFYSIQDSAFDHNWSGRVFVNPPYSRGSLQAWTDYAWNQSQQHSEVVVMLLPGDTSTKWFPWYATKLCFLYKRVAFDGIKSGAKFPTVIAVFKRYEEDPLSNLGQVIG
jgi:site-specific DNA-methyltransferase (adenine-specific)